MIRKKARKPLPSYKSMLSAGLGGNSAQKEPSDGKGASSKNEGASAGAGSDPAIPLDISEETVSDRAPAPLSRKKKDKEDRPKENSSSGADQRKEEEKKDPAAEQRRKSQSSEPAEQERSLAAKRGGDENMGDAPPSKKQRATSVPQRNVPERYSMAGAIIPAEAARRTQDAPRVPSIAAVTREHVNFRYTKETPLVNDAGACAELVRQMRGCAKDIPAPRDLAFSDRYMDASRAIIAQATRLNHLVSEYDSSLKKTRMELCKAQDSLKAKDRLFEKTKKEVTEKAQKLITERDQQVRRRRAAEEKVAAVEQELAAKDALIKRLEREKEAQALEAEKTETRLRKSRSREVTLERVRVETAMRSKTSRLADRFKGYAVARDAYEEKMLLLSQISGTRECVEMLREEGHCEVPQGILDRLIADEAKAKDEADHADYEELTESDLTLSPLILKSMYVSDEAAFENLDPSGTNTLLLSPEMAAALRSAPGSVEGGEVANAPKALDVPPLASASLVGDPPTVVPSKPTEDPKMPEVQTDPQLLLEIGRTEDGTERKSVEATVDEGTEVGDPAKVVEKEVESSARAVEEKIDDAEKAVEEQSDDAAEAVKQDAPQI